MKDLNKMVHLFLEFMAMLKSQLLITGLVLLFQYMVLLFHRVFYLIFPKKQDSRSYSSCQGKFQRLIFLLKEILYPNNYLMLFINITQKLI